MFRTTPLAFIGSSREGLVVAKAIQAELARSAEFVIWHQGLFGLSSGTLETLVRKANDFDFAVLVLTPDDVVVSRGEERASPRDNVLFELGLFIGTIGRERCFMVVDRSVELKLPSDLAGITPANYQPPQSGTWQASVGPACTAIEEEITRLGPISPRLPVRVSISQGLHAAQGYTVGLTIRNEGKQEIPPYDVVLASEVGSWRIFPTKQNGPLLADQRREHLYPVLGTDRSPAVMTRNLLSRLSDGVSPTFRLVLENSDKVLFEDEELGREITQEIRDLVSGKAFESGPSAEGDSSESQGSSTAKTRR